MNKKLAVKAIVAALAGDMIAARKYYNKIHEPEWKIWFVDREMNTATSGEETISLDELQARKERDRKQGFPWPTVDFADAQ